MKIRNLFAAAVLTLAVSPGAHALDATPAIKVMPLLRATTSWNGAPIAYPQGQAEISGMVIEIAPGAETGWHAHPVPSFGMVLEGTLEVTLKDGQTKRVGPGQGLVEVVGTVHNGRNIGTVPVRLVVFYAGAIGMALTVKPRDQ
ncbi:MAG: cupin domain-containing protein [Betaproteobacteria bacterium]